MSSLTPFVHGFLVAAIVLLILVCAVVVVAVLFRLALAWSASLLARRARETGRCPICNAPMPGASPPRRTPSGRPVPGRGVERQP